MKKAPESKKHISRPPGDVPLQSTTTTEQDVNTAGQRKVNLIWERTQAAIALMVAISTMAAGLIATWKDITIPTILSVAFGTVIGFYFSRTNHQSIGGTGPKPPLEIYKGR